MITKHDLHEAIAECEGVKNPNANTCLMLASFYTILDHMDKANVVDDYSYAPPPKIEDERVSYDSGTEFAEMVSGMEASKLIEIVDELMSTLQIINPKLYRGVMRKIADV